MIISIDAQKKKTKKKAFDKIQHQFMIKTVQKLALKEPTSTQESVYMISLQQIFSMVKTKHFP